MNCILCRDTGWVEIEPRGRMKRMAPCRCKAGEAAATAAAQFINDNPPDRVILPDENEGDTR